MALATQCPHCFTTFRVAADQLKLRGGIVRCGACQSIFDGNAHLIDLEKLAAEKAASEAANTAAAPPALPAPAAEAEAAEAAEAQPVHSLDFAHTFDPLGILPKAAAAGVAETEAETGSGTAAAADEPGAEPVPAPDEDTVAVAPHPDPLPDGGPVTPPPPAARPAPASAYAPPGRIEPSFDVPPDEALVAQPLPDFDPEPEPHTPPAPASEAEPAWQAAAPDGFPAALPLRASAGDHASMTVPALKSARNKALDARTRRSKLTPTRIEAPKLRVPVDGEADEPEFVKRSRRQERSSRTRRILLGTGIAVLLLVLAVQVLFEFRTPLAARYPGARPALGSACALFGCRVELPADVDNLAIETGELNPLGANAYVLDTLLRNGGNLAQAWPSIELELIDADDKPVLRRVLGPADYLPPGVHAGAGFAPHSEQPIKLHFALAGLTPSGYHTFVFYP